MHRVFLAKTTILGKLKFFFHLLLVSLGVMRNATAQRAFQLHHCILNLSHKKNLRLLKAFPLYVKTIFPSI